ncbi:MAG: MMPL family transporter, partial [Gammaproteobacteria bacterium]
MYISKLLKYRKTVISLWSVVLLGFSVALVMRLMSGAPLIDNSAGIWFQSDDKELARYQQYNREFGEQEWTLLMLKTDSIYAPAFLKDLADITARIERLPHVVKVTSIANVRDNFVTAADELEYRKIYPQPDKASAVIDATQLQQMRRQLVANPIFQDNLVKAGNDHATVVLIQNDNYIRDPSPYRIELVDHIDDIVKQYPLIQDYALAGTTVVNAELNRAAKRDVYIYYTLISVLLIIFGWLNFRNVRDLLVMFSVVLGSVIPSMGLIAVLDIPYNMITVMLPTILVSLAVAGVVHVINEFHNQHATVTRDRAVQNTIRQLWKPCLYTALTTIFGFASLTVSTVEPVFQLGLYAGIGIFLAWLTSITVAPLLLNLLWVRPKQSSRSQSLWLSALSDPKGWVNSKWIKFGLLAILFIPLFGLVQLETDTNYTKFFDDSTSVSKAYDDIDTEGFAQNPLSVVIEYPKGKRFSDERYFHAVLQFEQKLKSLPQVIKVISANELLRRIDKAFNGDHTSQATFNNYSASQVDQLLFLGELSGNDDIEDLLLRDKSQTQILVLTPYMSSKRLDRFREQVKQLKENTLPSGLEVYVTGTTVLWANMDEQVSETQLYSLAGVSIFLLLMFTAVFRSWRLIAVALLVNALPLAVTLGTMGLLDIKINIATALIGGITLGVVVDDTIHLFSRIKYYLKHGYDIASAVDKAVIHVGKSI